MADNIKIQLGSFMRSRKPDTPDDPFAPNGLPESGKDFLEIAKPVDPTLLRPTTVAPREPSEAISLPDQVPFQPAPALTPTTPAGPQPSQLPGLMPETPTDFRAPVPPIRPNIPIIGAPIIPQQKPFVPIGNTVPFGVSPSQPSQDPGKTSPAGGQPTQKLGSIPPLARVLAKVDTTAHVPAALRQVDSAVASFLASVDDSFNPLNGKYSFVGGGAPGSQNWNPGLYARQLVRIGQDAQKLAFFAVQQGGLFALNWHGRIWNPLTAAPLPTTELFTPAALDVMTGGTSPTDLLPGGFGGEKFYSNNELVNDRHLQLAKGTRTEVLGQINPPFVATVIEGGAVGPQNIKNLGARLIGAASQDSALVDNPITDGIPGTPLVQAAFNQRNLYGMDTSATAEGSYGNNQLVRMSELVAGTDKALETDAETGLKRFSTKSLFTPKNVSLGSSTPTEWRWKGGILLDRAESRSVDTLQKSAFTRGVIPAGFKAEKKGFLQRGQNEDPAKYIDEDEAYVPLSFTDIRPYGNGKVRTVYFRPFISNLSEEFNPEWSQTMGFGRVDPVVSYAGTIRTINLGFLVHTFAPEDLPVIYQKLMWLSSMVYPEYDKDLAYKAGPICRLRVGDLVSSGNPGGLGGKIDSLSFDYSEQLWELEKNSKVPMGYRVTLAFTVLHDTPIGRGIDGKFGGLGTIDQNGLYQPPSSVQSQADQTKRGPDVEDSADFRGFEADANDYDPTA